MVSVCCMPSATVNEMKESSLNPLSAHSNPVYFSHYCATTLGWQCSDIVIFCLGLRPAFTLHVVVFIVFTHTTAEKITMFISAPHSPSVYAAE